MLMTVPLTIRIHLFGRRRDLARFITNVLGQSLGQRVRVTGLRGSLYLIAGNFPDIVSEPLLHMSALHIDPAEQGSFIGSLKVLRSIKLLVLSHR